MSALYRISNGVYAKSDEMRFEYKNKLTAPLRVVLHEFESEMRLAGDIVYTSLLRPGDTDSVHAYGRGADVRLYHAQRGIEYGTVGAGLPHEGPASAWVFDAIERLGKMFGPWPGTDGKDHDVFVIHGENMHKHIHIQVPGRPWA